MHLILISNFDLMYLILILLVDLFVIELNLFHSKIFIKFIHFNVQ